MLFVAETGAKRTLFALLLMHDYHARSRQRVVASLCSFSLLRSPRRLGQRQQARKQCSFAGTSSR
jgi:hypothetical protein